MSVEFWTLTSAADRERTIALISRALGEAPQSDGPEVRSSRGSGDDLEQPAPPISGQAGSTARAALSVVEERVRMFADIHPCADCGLPTPYATGSYWLAPDDLWNDVVGSPALVLCPPCFTDRAAAKGIAVSWRAVRDA